MAARRTSSWLEGGWTGTGLLLTPRAGCLPSSSIAACHRAGVPSGLPVTLRPVTRANVRAVCDLRLADHQERLVAPAAFTVAEGHYEPGALLRAIYAGEQPAGVLLVEVETGTPYLVRFMIDAGAPGRRHRPGGRRAPRRGARRGRLERAGDELPAGGGRRRGLLAPLRIRGHGPDGARRARVPARPARAGSAAGEHDVVALGAQHLDHHVAVVALQLDHARPWRSRRRRSASSAGRRARAAPRRRAGRRRRS